MIARSRKPEATTFSRDHGAAIEGAPFTKVEDAGRLRTVHSQTNRSTTAARLLLVFSPPHLEGLLREASRVSDDQFPEIVAKYGMEFV